MSTPTTPVLPTVSVADSVSKNIDALVIGTRAAATDNGTPELLLGTKVVDTKSADAVRAALVAVGATGASGEVVRVPAPKSLGVDTVVAVGLGSADGDAADSSVTADAIREAAGNASRNLDGIASAATTLSHYQLSAAIEGHLLGAYRFDQFRSDKSAPSKAAVGALTFLVDKPKSAAVTSAAQRAQVIAESVALARDFVNTPPSHLFPEEFAARAKTFGTAAGLEIEILDYDDLVDGGYGGIVGVGKGSSRLPRLIRLTHTAAKPGRKDPAPKTVALVGKGITFDTGGISLKPAANMENMTSDMGGAAAVVASVIAAAKLNVPVHVVATVPMAENMPSDTAQRPGDVLTQLNGTTVEVINTDAEGRLILADAIVRACQDNPDYLIDTATLTGAQMVALGTRTPGVMGTDDFRDRVAALSREVGENAWPMPLPTELRADLKSRVADLANVTPHRWGGMLSAGTFLKEFVADGVQWAHIDVAGPAFNTGSPFGFTGKGGTGVPVRTICAVIDDIAAQG